MVSTLVQLDSFEPGSAPWAEQRRWAVGGSEISAVLGLHPWESRFSLWHRKRGTVAAQPDNPQMEWGRRLEPVIIAKYTEDRPEIEVVPGGTFTRSDRPWQIASLDARAGEGVVEAKTQHDDRDREWGEEGTDEVPVYYRAQAIWNCGVLGAPWCDLPVLISGSDFRVYRVLFDADEFEFMSGEARDFIGTLERDERPSIDAHQATYQAIRELHPDIEPVSVDLPADLARTYCVARHELKAAEKEADRQRSLVADHIGNAQYAKYLGQTIARRQAKQGGKPYLVAGDDLPTFTSGDTAA